MDDLRAWLTQSGTKSSAVKADKFGLRLFTALAGILVEGRIILTKFVGYLFFLCLHLFIVDFVVLLGSADLLDVGIYDQVHGPSEHFFNRMHLRAVRAFI